MTSPAGSGVGWSRLEEAAPEIARLGRKRLGQVGVAMLATLRPDGWPRDGPVEAHVAAGELFVGVMPRSLRARDLERDSRCTLQSVVTDSHSGEGELKLYGRLLEVEEAVREAAAGAWWVGRPPADARVFCFQVTEAAFVSWDTRRGEMTVHSWSPRRGSQTRTQPYP